MLRYGEAVRVWEMAPPLVAGQPSLLKTGRDPKCAAHVVGWLDLKGDERDGMTEWLAEVETEGEQRPVGPRMWLQYTVSLDPKDEWAMDERNVPLFRRFSCASFVLKAYAEGAGVVLLDLSDPLRFPEVDLDSVCRAYEPRIRTLERFRSNIGLAEAGPWRIVQAAYVLHAFDRPDEQIRLAAHTVTGPEECDFPLPAPGRSE